MKLTLVLGIALSVWMPSSVPVAVPGSTSDSTEPPQRVRVLIGEEEIELSLDGTAALLADGRVVRAELLPTRVFSVPGSFRFEYPRSWRHSASFGAPTETDGWWALGGERVHLFLRRHGEDAQRLLEEYVAHSIACGGTGKRTATIELAGRKLAGFAVDHRVGGLHGAPLTNAEMQVFGWQERPGVAWLLQIQQDQPAESTLEIAVPKIALQNYEGRTTETVDSATAGEAPAAVASAAELMLFLRTFRWVRD